MRVTGFGCLVRVRPMSAGRTRSFPVLNGLVSRAATRAPALAAAFPGVQHWIFPKTGMSAAALGAATGLACR